MNGFAPATIPWYGFRERLLERSRAMAGAGDEAGAKALRELVDAWWGEQQAWEGALREALMANHEINNALVGVSGNVQLLLMSPAGRQPGVRERLQTVLREAGRVERATRALAERKALLGIAPPTSEAGEGRDGRAAPAA